MAVGDQYRLQIRYYAGEHYCVSKLDYEMQDERLSPDLAVQQLVGTFWDQVVAGTWAALCASNVFVVQLYARRIFPSPSIPFSRTETGPVVNVTTCIPPCSPLCLTFYSDLGPQLRRGRVHLSLISEFHAQSGTLTQAGYTLAQALAESLIQLPSPDTGFSNVYRLVVGAGDGVEGVPVVRVRINPEFRVRRSRIEYPQVI